MSSYKPVIGVDVGEATSVAEILARAEEVDSSCENYALPLYRGVANADWPLIPQHLKKFGLWQERQQYAAVRKALATRHPIEPADSDHPRWVSLMQHHGTATRLLDWSAALLVAAYFVVWKDTPENPSAQTGAIWITMAGILNENLTGTTDMYSLSDNHFLSLTDGSLKTRTGLICAVAPAEYDIRMMVQSGYFTVHDNEIPLDQIPEARKALRRIVIPAHAKLRIKAQLEKCGVHRASMFPDIDNLSEHVKETSIPASYRNELTRREDKVRAGGKWFVAKSKADAKGIFSYPRRDGSKIIVNQSEAYGM